MTGFETQTPRPYSISFMQLYIGQIPAPPWSSLLPKPLNFRALLRTRQLQQPIRRHLQ
jgi:hypothetical protein